MSTLQRAMIAILFVLACVYLFRPVTGFQAEVARRKKISPVEAKKALDDYTEKAKKNADLRKQEDLEKQAAVAAALEAQRRAQEEKLQAERDEFERRRVNAMAAQAQVANQKAMAVPPPRPMGANAQRTTPTATSKPNTPKLLFANNPRPQPSAPQPEAIVTTVFKTRYLYLKIKGAILKFDVVKSLSDPQLDALTKVLTATCLVPQSTESRCRKTVTVDRSFATASRSQDGDSSGWNLECVGTLRDCTDPSKASQLVLTALPRSGTVTLARGFEVQTIGRTPASKSKAAGNEVFQVEKVYVTRNMK